MGEATPSLLECSINVILANILALEPSLQFLPVKLKMKLFKLMCKRGLLTDSNIRLVLHKDIVDLDLTESTVSDSSILEIGRCVSLYKLNLNSMKGNRIEITSKVLDELIQSLPCLRVLYLRRCSLIDDRPVCSAAKCIFLSELNLDGCVLVTDVGVSALAKHSPLLKNLNLSKTQVSDLGLTNLAMGVCRNMLGEIEVPYCKNVTDKGINILSQNCPKLTILLFHGCPQVSSGSGLNLQISPTSPMRMLSWTIR